MASKKKTKSSARGARKRRGQGEDMTGKQASQVEVRTPVDTMELPLPKPVDYQHHRKTILGYRDQMKSAQGRYRKALKAAQEAGIDTDAMLEAKRIADANDPKKTAIQLNQLAFALQQEGFPIHIVVQDTLAGDHEELVARRGYEDGKAGRSPNNKYPAGSDLALVYDTNWQKGQAELVLGPQDESEEGEEEPTHDLKSPPDLPGEAQQHAHH